MCVRLVFLGRLEDVAGGAERAVPLPEPATLEVLVQRLEPALATALAGDRVRMALNGDVVGSPGTELEFAL